ncbi:2-phosphosulfolactate phosphatase [Microbacterium sp. ASV81]|uniref:Probable 2-phosphosulfolactate phosphatase n=1 Tax=Microbacterium capsulatum TaxID=3041921 RepID=A0ABU0XJP0_9MICO|nr:2-phosphosulfolactate phosphatase [Microbacterium sp. ASV81]MDQ4214864.1 2-phosphosulfolactate phosphatase [Microbacterium sp. ASV81]
MRTPLSPDQPLQQDYEVRFEWAHEGLRSIAPGAGVVVLVDAVSFSTTVERAVAEGIEVQPFAGGRDEAERLAAEGAFGDARLAGRRGDPGVSLSPSSLTAENVAAFGATRAVVTSFNGSRLAAAAASFGVPVIAASLRNRTAVAEWILAHQHGLGRRARVAVVAAGEVRDDETVRFSVEDMLTAGAVIDALGTLGIDACSPEAAAACASYTGLSRAIRHLFTASTSGVELREDGEGADVDLAAQVDVSRTVPVLVDGVFRVMDPVSPVYG